MDTPTSRAGFRGTVWFALLWAVPLAIVVLLAIVLAATGLRAVPAVEGFIAEYPGESALPADAAPGIPAFVAWQHALNAIFLLLLLRSGWQIHRAKRPPAFWTRRNDGAIRTTNPPVRIGLPTWFHFVVDSVWVLNGLVFLVLAFASGHWVRIVPTNWDVFPHAASVALQYASLNWPATNGWVNYNALQLLAYFGTVFIAAPLAVCTGLRMSPGFAYRLRWLDRAFPQRIARTVHFWVMGWFVIFIVAHVTMVFATGAVRNLNHMYALRDDGGWVGLLVFAASVVVMVVAWLAARPALLIPLAKRSGTVRH
jgi:thiosulfate reductase cytochrome b subunit